MAVKASSNITLYHVIDVASVTIYYLLQSSTANPPAKPTTDNPGGNWSTTEPTYTEGSTNTLYTVTKTKFSDGTFEYTPVSKSSSYEAAKNAYNKALNAENTANTTQENLDNLQIGGKNILRKSKEFGNEGVSNTETGYLRSKGTVTTDQSIDDFTVVTCTPSSASILGEWLINGCKNGETYTLSFWVKGAGAPRCYFYGPSGYIGCEKVITQNGIGNGSDGNSDTGAGGVPVSNSEWQRVWVTWKLKDTGGTTDQKYVLIRNDNKVEVYVAGAKFEKGNKATDWTPAPEDVEDAILTVDEKRDYIVGTQTAATRFWTGISNFTSLKDGQEIIYWLPYATAYTNAGDRTVGVNMRVNSTITKNAGTTIISFETGTSTNVVWLNLTLKGGNSTGWIPCYYGGTQRLTSHYGAGNSIHLVYRVNAKIGGEAATAQYTGWFADANYVDGNNTDRLRFQNDIKTNKQYVWSGRLIVSDDNGYFPLRNGSSFNKDRSMLWAGTNLGPLSTGNNNYIAYPGWDMRYNAYQYYSNSKWNNGTVYNLIDVNIGSNKMYSGNKITGTSTTATIFSGSGITAAVVNDRYVNTDNGNYYKCTVAGAAAVAKWVYEGSSIIPAGQRIYWGTHLTHTDGSAKATATAISSVAIGDKYINHSTGRLYECTVAGASGTAQWTDKGVILQNNKTVYLVGVIHGQTITADSVPFVTEEPTEEDGKIYIAIGMAYQVYACGLFPEHPVFMYKGSEFKSIEQITYDTANLANQAADDASKAKSDIQRFLEGDEDTTLSKLKSTVTEQINTATGEITDNFETLVGNTSYGQQAAAAATDLQSINSFIKRAVNSSGQPYIELGVQPSASVPQTYRLRIENDEIYMVYGSGDSEDLLPLTRWYSKDGKSSFEVNTLLTQQEMAIEPFRFIKNDDGSLSFRKVE